MIRRLISLIIVAVIGLMGYNMFFGTDEDKARGQVVAKETKELVGSIFGFLKAEKENYDSGKFDNAMQSAGTHERFGTEKRPTRQAH